MSVHPPCIKCELSDNSNGLYTCNGCRRSFCSNHSIDHSNELRNRFDGIINEYNLINEMFCVYKQKSNDFRELEKEINEIKMQLNEKQKISNYSEKDLDEWMIKLEKLKKKLTENNQSNSSTFKTNGIFMSKGYMKYLTIVFIVLIAYCISFALIKYSPLSKHRFNKVNGPIQLLADGYVAEHYGLDFVHGSFRLDQNCVKGVHHTRLTFEKLSSSNAFIGIIEANTEQPISSLHGWFIGNKQVISNKPGEYMITQIFNKIWSSLTPTHVKQEDILEVKIDCTNSIISLTNTRTNKKFELNIDLEQSPSPWEIIINLDRHGDRVRLLQ